MCYSTCSIHAEENEEVVAKALEQQPAPASPLPAATNATQTAKVLAAASIAPPRPSDTAEGSCSTPAGERPSTPTPNDYSGGRFKLSRCLSKWPRRGCAVSDLDESQAACVVRTDPSEDETNGFFVAIFERERGVSGGGSMGEGGTKKRRNRHKNRKKNKKKRKMEEAGRRQGVTGEGEGEDKDEGDGVPGLSAAVAVLTESADNEAGVGVRNKR